MPIAKLNEVVVFPKGFPSVTTGVLLLEEQILITGHENGFVIKWDIQKKTSTRLHDGNSPIRTVAYSGSNEIAIGCDSGALVIVSLNEPEKKETIRKPTYNKFSRVWRAIWLGKDRLVITSTYGELRFYDRVSQGMWSTDVIRGHSDSIFGIASSNAKYLLTGDYRGNMLVWEKKNNDLHTLQRLGIQQTVQDAKWYKDEGFVVINRSGRIYLFEKESKKPNSWQNVFEIDIATGTGNCVSITDDGKTIFAGTDNELIQFDRESQQIDHTPFGAKRIFTQENTIYILTDKGLQSFERKEVEAPKEVINYKFAKIGLLGHTGTGKTTLCNYIIYNSLCDVSSTFGKRVWNWILPKDNEVEKRIILSDYGGQESVLETFLPFLRDSDIILIFFKQTDKMTFEKALRILNRMKKNVKPETKIMFVQTFIDDEMKDVPEAEIEVLKKQGQIMDNIKISPKKNLGLEDFRKRIINSIEWDNARIMIKSPYTEGISRTLTYIQEEGIPAIAYGKFKAIYQEMIKGNIPDRHLKFLLRDYTNQGIIEYYPEIIDLLIFNDEKYNKLMTNIPIYTEQRRGIVSIDELRKEFGDTAYLAIIDEVYTNSKISIRNGNLRIFPDKLSDEPINIPASHKDCFKGALKDEIRLPYQYIEVELLIDALSEISLQCIAASQREGIFSWEKKACIYYSFSETGDDIAGRCVKCAFYIGGEDETRKRRLSNEFNSIIKKLYGTGNEDELQSQVKKKRLKDAEIDVALSFAGEQREYVGRVATRLASSGIKVFYDEFYESQLWGKNLPDYLEEVYYTKSNFCIMFVSKEYVTRMWPEHERKCAIMRDIEEFGDYILPVVFDKIHVPGLDPGKKYLLAEGRTPEQIAEIFIEKYEKAMKEENS